MLSERTRNLRAHLSGELPGIRNVLTERSRFATLTAVQVDAFLSGHPDEEFIETWWPDPEDGPYRVRFVVVLAEGRPRIARLEIDGMAFGAGGPVTPITSESVRLPVAQLLHDAMPMIRDLADTAASGRGMAARFFAHPTVREALQVNSRPGRPRLWGDEHFREVADVYTRAMADGFPPTTAVRTHWNVSKSTAAKWVARCRDDGLLPKTSRGKARGAGAGTDRSVQGSGAKRRKRR